MRGCRVELAKVVASSGCGRDPLNDTNPQGRPMGVIWPTSDSLHCVPSGLAFRSATH